MAQGYRPGQVVGGFEIIRQEGSYASGGGNQRGLYRVRCLSCGKEETMKSWEIRYRGDCGCQKQRGKHSVGRPPVIRRRTAPATWMDKGEIYRSWKASKDRDQAISVLAQLNDVPEKVITEIIREYRED